MRIIFVAAVLAAFALTACASVTAGSGRGRAVAPVPTAAATTSAAPTPTDAPSTPAGPPPSTTTQPHICQERCRTVAHADLGGGLTVELAQAPGTISVIVVRRDGELRTAGWIDDERPGSLTCSTRPEPNCVVIDAIAMHAAKAWGVSFADDNVDLYDSVVTDTPVIVAKDVDGNGWVDALAVQSTERPSYAAAPRFWVTFVSDGHHLTGTGCTTPTMHEQPVPTIVLTGDCA